MVKYVYDKKTESFVPKRPGLRDILLASLKYGVASLLVALLFYGVFALVFSTDHERDLERENRMLAEEYAGLSDRLDRLDDVVGNLQVRDREIYRDLFSADPPNYITEERDTLLSGAGDLESMQEEDLVWDTYAVTKRAESVARQVTAWLAEVDTVLQRGEIVPTGIPSLVPVAGFSPLQTGASVGRKVNPFYKTVREHTGLDIVAPIGTPVRCSADGRVARVERSEKGRGNEVVVEHKGGYQTVYSHLDRIDVGVGQTVRQGARLGRVGQSGSCFAPCLHYEVLRDGRPQDPVNYFFAELDPATYRDMMIVALTTGQSLD